jgi:tetratricopeptide (TPR) repeat protein
MPARPVTALLLLLLASTAVSCGGGGESVSSSSPTVTAAENGAVTNTKILGKWRRLSDTNRGQVEVEFQEGGSCVSLEGRTEISCRWSELPEGQVEVELGSVVAKGTIKEDEMVLNQEDGTKSSWVRAGSQLDKNNTDFSEGMALIQSGNFMAGMAQWQRAADKGHHGAQNSLAWIHAADKNPALHDGKKAVAYAEKATASARHYTYLDTYAAALARDRQFDRAVKIEQEAIGLLEKDTGLPEANREAALQRFRKRLALYMSGQPYADS